MVPKKNMKMISSNETRVFEPLRVVLHRLSSTPVKQLPYITPNLVTIIAGCGKIFNVSESERHRTRGSENSVLVHKYQTQIATFLQEKGPEKRLTAVVLIKATVEVGGWNVLQGAKPWVGGLINMLGVSISNLQIAFDNSFSRCREVLPDLKCSHSLRD